MMWWPRPGNTIEGFAFISYEPLEREREASEDPKREVLLS